MGIVRILVDGYSLHHWPELELAPGKPRHSFYARDALVSVLTQTIRMPPATSPVTVIFDGGGAPPGTPKNESAKSGIEVLYSKKGQTADQVIERVSHLMKPYGEVMAVTNDYAERETVISLGGSACSCENFIRMIDENVGGMQVNLKELNARERKAAWSPTGVPVDTPPANSYARPEMGMHAWTQGVIDRIDTAHLSGDSRRCAARHFARVGAGKRGDNRQVMRLEIIEKNIELAKRKSQPVYLSGHRQHSFLCGLPGWLESGRVRGRGPGCGLGGHEAGLSPPKLGGLDHR